MNKPLIPTTILPIEFNLRKRLQKHKSEEKFALNDLIDFSRKDFVKNKQGKFEN